MRDPKAKARAGKKKKAKALAAAAQHADADMEDDVEGGPSTSTAGAPAVFRPGIDPVAEDEQLEYDPTAYDCYHKFQLDWPCLSFDVLRDGLGGPRSTFPHTVFMVAGTQAPSARQNYIAFLKLGSLGQGRHGKKAKTASSDSDESSSDDSSSDGSDSEDEEMAGAGPVGDNPIFGKAADAASGKPADAPGKSSEPRPTFHYRTVAHMGGINRIRSMHQTPGIVAVWGDTGHVRIYDGTQLVVDIDAETESTNASLSKTKAKAELKPCCVHAHSTEGYALDWSRVKAGRLASGDCKGRLHVWEPQNGASWQVSSSYAGHTDSVEDLQWSPAEETVFASCSVDQTVRIWDTRERTKPMLTVKAHDNDVNVISWSRLVNYMLASGCQDGSFRIWDLRAFAQGSHVSHFAFHRASVTSIEWCTHEGSMLATASADNQLAVWDLALERDPEEEAALAPASISNAAAPEDLPAQLLFLHAGQTDLKELHWHPQIPGLLASTAADGFDVFKAANN